MAKEKFNRICVELDLTQPLKQGTWVRYGDHCVFILVLYGKLLVYCYSYGRVDHGEASYTFTCNPSSKHPLNVWF